MTLLVLIDAHYKFIAVNIGSYGKYSDREMFAKTNHKKTQIWKISPLKMDMQNFSSKGKVQKLFQFEMGS